MLKARLSFTRRLRQLALENQLKEIHLDIRNLVYGTDLTNERMLNFIQKLQQPGNEWRQCFEIVPGLNQIWITTLYQNQLP